MIRLPPYHEIFYNEWKLNPLRSDYSIVIDNEMQGELDPARLNLALHRLSEDYFLLHSNVKEIGGLYYWVARPDKYIKLDYFDTSLTNNELLAYVRAPFDLTTGAMLRVALVKLADKHFRIVVVAHHLIIDGAKVEFMFETISNYYNDTTYRFNVTIQEQCKRLNELAQYYANWLDNTEEGHQHFWRSQLSDVPGVNFQFLRTSAEDQEIEGNSVGEHVFTFNAEISKKIKYVAKKYATTPYLLSLSIFFALLYRHTQQEKSGLYLPVAIPEGSEFIYGTHICPSIISYSFSQTTTLLEMIKQTKACFKAIKSDNHYHFPLQKISTSLVNKDLMDVAFAQTNLKNRLFHFQGTFNEKVNTALHIDLSGKLLFLQELKDNLTHYRVMYQKQCIDSDILLNFINTYQRLFVEILDDLCNNKKDTLISKYSLVDEAQRHLVTQKWNDTESPYPHKTLHQLFEEQAVKTPKAIALAYENETWTYAQLNKTSNQLAHYLQSNFYLQPDDVIGLCLKPGYHMIMALWAVLKSGAAYLPIDRTHPDERITYQLNDTKAKAVLTDQHSVNRFSHIVEQNKVGVVNLDAQQTKFELLKQSNENLNSITQPHHLAYVIYTSGTQGQPNGVLIEHRSVVNYATYLMRYNQLSETSVGAKYASFSFDASVIEIYPILLSGGKLCLIKEEDRLDCEKVNDFFHQHGVTFAFLPTPFAELFFELENSSLKNLIVGGDKLKKIIPRGYKTINAYGPTETTVQATMYAPGKNKENIPIGKPINNIQCYVVDSNCNLLPIGSIGELLIGGDGLAREYLNLPDITAQKFICNPFQSEQEKAENKNTRLYRTGDLARWLPDGDLEFIGRNDDQVKVRGYRVELSEIEYGLMQYPEIQQVVVVAVSKADAPNEKHIVAYYVAQTSLNQASLNNYLSKQFPAYMHPATYVRMQNMPLSISGKINKQALPSPSWNGEEQPYIAPINLLEKAVCSVYAQILGLKESQIGVNHDFFELGGNSISAIRLSYLLQRHFKINVTDVFKLKTPANLVSELPPAEENILLKGLQIKKLYENKFSFALQDMDTKAVSKDIARQHHHYLEQLKQLNPDVVTRNNIQSVLLTGATGFLGCHLLATLLEETTYTIYLPVRAATDAAAFDRVNQKFKYYFKTGLENQLKRIRVFSAYLHKEMLGLDTEQYQTLAAQVNSIIHCAALVKYYGHDEEFDRANIQPTVQLLELAKLTANKDFHYISSVGVLLDGHVVDQDYSIFTEDDNLTKLVRGNHPYVQSKYKAEQLVIQCRSHGINGTVYRVGNLAINSQTHAIQENYEENMFFALFKAMIDFQMTPKEITQMEVSPVEYTALAIVKLFDKTVLSNQIHHVFSPEVVNLHKVLAYFMDLKNKEYSMEKFIEKVIMNVERSVSTSDNISLFMLYQFWLHQVDGNHATAIRITQKKTEQILAKLGFQWPTLTPAMFHKIVNQSSSFH